MKLKYAGTCEFCGKVQYPTRKDAKEARRLMKGKGLPQSGVGVYQCGDYWHLGHLSASVRNGRLSREQRYSEPEVAPEVVESDISVARRIVFARAKNRCEVCGGPGQEFSHRRSKGVRDKYTDTPENGLCACRTCHAEMHANPEQARRLGHHVSRYTVYPGDVPVYLKGGWWLLASDGTMALTDRRIN